MPSTRRVKSSVRTHRGRHAPRPSPEQSSLGASKVGSHQASTLRSTKLLQNQHLILERINTSVENERSMEGVAQDCLQALLGSERKIRRVSDTPVAVGFGIATANEAAQVAGIADGVIIGSAIVRQVEQYQHDPQMTEHVAGFVRSVKQAMNRQQPVSDLN